MTIRVMLVDDQALLRTGFRMVLAAQPDMDVVAEAGDGDEAVQLLAVTKVDVVLMDVRMPRLDGVEATRRICADKPAEAPPKVLILTTFDLDEYAFSALQAGASGFMLKDVPPGDLLSAIRAVHSGDAVVAPSTTRRLIDRFTAVMPAPAGERAHPELKRLTGREREVLLLIAQGLSNGEIAAQLVLSEATVKNMWGGSSRSWSCGTGCRRWSWPTRRVWYGPEADGVRRPAAGVRARRRHRRPAGTGGLEPSGVRKAVRDAAPPRLSAAGPPAATRPGGRPRAATVRTARTARGAA